METSFKVDEKTLHELSTLVGKNAAEFQAHFEGKNLGYVLSIRNLIQGMYESARKTKDELIDLRAKLPQGSKKRGEINATIDSLYAVMTNLEFKHSLLQDMVKNRVTLD